MAKISKDPREPVESYFQDCEMQALAAYLAQEFNKLSLPKKIDYLEASVIECHDRVSPVPGVIGDEAQGLVAKCTSSSISIVCVETMFFLQRVTFPALKEAHASGSATIAGSRSAVDCTF